MPDRSQPSDRENRRDADADAAGRRIDRASDSTDAEPESGADLRADAPATLSAAPHPADAEEAGLTDEEIAIYRRRVVDGLYNTREVADEVARRMMKRGDI